MAESQPDPVTDWLLTGDPAIRAFLFRPVGITIY